MYPTHGDPHVEPPSTKTGGGDETKPAAHYPIANAIVARQLGCPANRVSVDPADVRSADSTSSAAGADTGSCPWGGLQAVIHAMRVMFTGVLSAINVCVERLEKKLRAASSAIRGGSADSRWDAIARAACVDEPGGVLAESHTVETDELEPAFASSADPELWVMMLEKAYAK